MERPEIEERLQQIEQAIEQVEKESNIRLNVLYGEKYRLEGILEAMKSPLEQAMERIRRSNVFKSWVKPGIINRAESKQNVGRIDELLDLLARKMDEKYQHDIQLLLDNNIDPDTV